MRKQGEKYYAAANSTGYRWVESEAVASESNRDNIDLSFYRNLVDKMVDEMNKFGDFEWFVSDDPYIPAPKEQKMDDFMNIPVDAPEEIPFDEDLPFA